ncbi:MAG: DUF1800 domain-containing protein [Bacteroidota bacterium]
MNRRQLFKLELSEDNDSPVLQSSTGLTPYGGSWTIAEVKHLLRRTMFGATKADVNYFLSAGLSQTIAELLSAPVAPAPPLYVYTSNYNDPDVAFGDTWITAPVNPLANTLRIKSYRGWWANQLLTQNRSIQEKMVLFWHNHFATETAGVNDARYCYLHNTLLRQFALGNFKDLTRAITLDPAMLKYLNGYLNSENAPDENYGRELQELFTVGKDENGIPYYSEDDVQNAAKVLTGYRINATTISSYFDSNRHNATNKIFSAFYNNTVITGQSGSAGANELDDLLDMIFGTQQVAVFICRKIYRYFMYYIIDAQIEADVIQPLANIFRTNNYEIAPVIEALLSSEHFFDAANSGSLIKTPLDFTVALCRDFSVTFPDNTLLEDQYFLWNKIHSQAGTMGQMLGDPPNVAGWPAYYQEPSFHELWINSSTLPSRNSFSDKMAHSGYASTNSLIIIDFVLYTTTLDAPDDPGMLIQEVIDRHLSTDVSQTIKDYLKSFLLSGQISDSYWTSAWNDYIGDPNDMGYYQIVQSRLEDMYKYLMDLPEYQLS